MQKILKILSILSLRKTGRHRKHLLHVEKLSDGFCRLRYAASDALIFGSIRRGKGDASPSLGGWSYFRGSTPGTGSLDAYLIVCRTYSFYLGQSLHKVSTADVSRFPYLGHCRRCMRKSSGLVDGSKIPVKHDGQRLRLFSFTSSLCVGLGVGQKYTKVMISLQSSSLCSSVFGLSVAVTADCKMYVACKHSKQFASVTTCVMVRSCYRCRCFAMLACPLSVFCMHV